MGAFQIAKEQKRTRPLKTGVLPDTKRTKLKENQTKHYEGEKPSIRKPWKEGAHKTERATKRTNAERFGRAGRRGGEIERAGANMPHDTTLAETRT